MEKILLYLGALLPFAWGVSHLFPTRSVVKGFGEISEDNRNIITMEWIIEGVALIFVGAIVAVVTALGPNHTVATAVYIVTSIFLLVLAMVSLFTGFRINFLPFRLCPVIFTTSAVLITIGWMSLR